jgi:uncharacterized protein (DUF2252 family)
VNELFKLDDVRLLATMLRSRKDNASVEVLDAAYWVKGCSSLGRLRFAVVLGVGRRSKRMLCLMDVKEATDAAAPRYPRTWVPKCNAERVVEGSRHLAPHLGERMRAACLCGRSVFVRELLPQDLRSAIEFTRQAAAPPRGFASAVGQAAARVHCLICGIARGCSELDSSALGLLAAEEAGLDRRRAPRVNVETMRTH